MIALRLTLVGALLAVGGCSAPSSPTQQLFRTGQDARVYNAMTGRYEWPDEPAALRHPRTRERLSGDAGSAQPSAGNERIYNAQNGRFEAPR